MRRTASLVACVALLAVAGWLELVSGFALAPAQVTVLVATLATFGWQLWTRSTPRTGPSAGPPAAASSGAV